MTQTTSPANLHYEDLHATVVDALRHNIEGDALDHAAHEVLDRLRNHGVAIPARSSSRGPIRGYVQPVGNLLQTAKSYRGYEHVVEPTHPFSY